jgi:hypothetical protein
MDRFLKYDLFLAFEGRPPYLDSKIRRATGQDRFSRMEVDRIDPIGMPFHSLHQFGSILDRQIDK